MSLRANRTTGFDTDVFKFIADKCEKESISWNDVVNELIRKGISNQEVNE